MRHVVDHVDRDRAVDRVAVGVRGRVVEGLHTIDRVCPVVGRRAIDRRVQRVAVRAVRVQRQRAMRARAVRAARKRVAHRAGHGQRAARGLGIAARRAAVRERRLVHREGVVVRAQAHVGDVDVQRHRRGVAITIRDGVHEVIHSVRAHRVRIGLVGIVAVGVQDQRAVRPRNPRPAQIATDRRRRVRTRGHTRHRAARGGPIGTQHIAHAVGQHVAGNLRAFGHAVGVGVRRRRIVHDVDHQMPRARGLAIGIAHLHVEAYRSVVPGGIVRKRIAVVDRARASRHVVRVVCAQAIAQVRRAGRIRAGDRLAAQRHAAQPIQGGEGDRPAGGRRAIARMRALGLAAARRQARLGHDGTCLAGRRDVTQHRHRVADVDRQRRRVGVRVPIAQGVGEHVVHPARRARIAHVAVPAVRTDRQHAVLAVDHQIARAIGRGRVGRLVVAGNRAHVRAIGALHVGIGRAAGRALARDHVARGRRATGRDAVHVQMRRRRIVHDVDHQVVARAAALAIGIGHIHRVRHRRVVARVVHQRVRVVDHPGARGRVVLVVRAHRAARSIVKRRRSARFVAQEVAAQAHRAEAVLRGEADRALGHRRPAGIRTRRLARAARGQQARLVHLRVRAARRRDRADRRRFIADLDRQRRRVGVRVPIAQGVGEHVVHPARRARIAHVAVPAVRTDRQHAVLAVDHQIARAIGRGRVGRLVVAGNRAHVRAIGALHVGIGRAAGRALARDHVARLGRELARGHAVRVRMRVRHVVHDPDAQILAVGIAIRILGHDREAIGRRDAAHLRRIDQRIGVIDRNRAIGVLTVAMQLHRAVPGVHSLGLSAQGLQFRLAQHQRGRVAAGIGIAQRHRVRIIQPIQRFDREVGFSGQVGRLRIAARGQAAFIHHAVGHVARHRLVVVAGLSRRHVHRHAIIGPRDRDYQVRLGRILVAVGQRVLEGFDGFLALAQRLQSQVARIFDITHQRIGIVAFGIDRQVAILAMHLRRPAGWHRLAGRRARSLDARHRRAVGALLVRMIARRGAIDSQDIAGHRRVVLADRIGVIDGHRHRVRDVRHQIGRSRAAQAVIDDDGDAVGQRVLVQGVIQRAVGPVGVIHRPGGGIVMGQGQRALFRIDDDRRRPRRRQEVQFRLRHGHAAGLVGFGSEGELQVVQTRGCGEGERTGHPAFRIVFGNGENAGGHFGATLAPVGVAADVDRRRRRHRHRRGRVIRRGGDAAQLHEFRRLHARARIGQSQGRGGLDHAGQAREAVAAATATSQHRCGRIQDGERILARVKRGQHLVGHGIGRRRHRVVGRLRLRRGQVLGHQHVGVLADDHRRHAAGLQGHAGALARHDVCVHRHAHAFVQRDHRAVGCAHPGLAGDVSDQNGIGSHVGIPVMNSATPASTGNARKRRSFVWMLRVRRCSAYWRERQYDPDPGPGYASTPRAACAACWSMPWTRRASIRRSVTPSFSKMAEMCARTVRSVMPRLSAMDWFEWPRAT